MKTSRSTLLLFCASLIISATLISCTGTSDSSEYSVAANEDELAEKIVYDTDSPKSMIMAVIEACGGIEKLKSLNDVEFDYDYVSPDGKKDVSKERYIFDNEISWAKYSVHEVNVSPDLEGSIVQFYDGKSAKVYNDGQPLDDPQIVGTGQFLRQANYMWFTMMFKFTDPGIIYTYEGQEEIDSTTFDIVTVTYDSAVTGKAQNDIFKVYINPETRMVESFYFSLPAFGFEQPVLHAKLTYEEIDGIQVITRRIMTAPSPDGDGMVPMVDQHLTNIKFNNGFTSAQLSEDI